MHADVKKNEGSFKNIFYIFLKLGLTSFGGPAAHIAFFREEFVSRRNWLNDQAYAELVALCHFLPGPASSQVGFAIGLARGGKPGALAAWLGFTLPSAVVLIAFALGLNTFDYSELSGVIAGLKIVAFAIVAQATWMMMKSLCATYLLRIMMIGSALLVYFFSAFWMQLIVMLVAGIIGMVFSNSPLVNSMHTPLKKVAGNKKNAYGALLLFLALLITLPLAAVYWPNSLVSISSVFYKAGALVFGGGHVVLPLLQNDMAANQWVSNDAFMAGYGLTQAMPGPLFTFAAFLGASLNTTFLNHTVIMQCLMGVFCLLLIFLPAFLILTGALPFWSSLKNNRLFTAALIGINAAVVGFLAAILAGPIGAGALTGVNSLLLTGIATSIVFIAKPAPWLMVVGCGLAGHFFLSY